MRKMGTLFLILSFVTVGYCYGKTSVTVDVDNPVAEIQSTMWGIFFEDINFAADGGIYAELIKNRSFEFPDPTEGWDVEGADFFSSPMLIINRSESYPNNPRIAQLNISGSTCISNSGFRGIGVKEKNQYRLSILSSVKKGNVKINATLIGSDGTEIGRTVINPANESWKKYEAVFEADKTDAKASIKLCFEGEGTIEFDMVSLFPVDTWKKRNNGLRADLVKMLADLEPGFLRFPGGCIVEGRDLDKRYQWKNTVGNIEDRKLIINRWNDEFDKNDSRATPDYFQSFGLGFYEYFLLAEDLDAEPLPTINCGMACQFNTAEVVAMENMDPYVQDALDLIEFANGPADSKWGKIRTEMGHPEPFNLKYLGIGNEQWGIQYFERYALFEKVITEKYPEIKLVSSTGPMASGSLFDNNVAELKNYNPALVDEHYYMGPEWFFNNATRYDQYDRNTYKIFAGEYAADTDQIASAENMNTWGSALAEAAFMTGLERNADVVSMASYAALLAHIDAWQWTPDLIWFDNLSSYGTPNYYVQKLFSTNSGTDVLNILNNGKPLTGENSLYATAAWDKNNKELILKLVNSAEENQILDVRLQTNKRFRTDGKLIVLTSENLDDMNSIDNAKYIFPVEKGIELREQNLEVELDPHSLAIIKLQEQ